MTRRDLYMVALQALIVALSGLALMFLLGCQARAHDWYPLECCSGMDCAPAEAAISSWNSLVPGQIPDLVVTTRHGTATVTQQTSRRDSKDSRLHACIHNGRVVCIFYPPGQ